MLPKISIEWEIGKSKGDRFLIAIAVYLIYYIQRYFQLLFKNYDKLRNKSKVPHFTNINFSKVLYPYVFLFILVPSCFYFLFHNYLGESVMIIVLLFMFLVNAIFFGLGFIYLIYRMIIDFVVSTFCYILALVRTTNNSINKISSIAKGGK